LYVDLEEALFFSAGNTGIGNGGSFSRVEVKEYFYKLWTFKKHTQAEARIN
jgi:hypothetical protein